MSNAELYKKAEAVVLSCKTKEQAIVAGRYVSRMKMLFDARGDDFWSAKLWSLLWDVEHTIFN